MFALSLVSCGKKAQELDGNRTDQEISSAQTDLEEETHKELYEAIKQDNLIGLKKLLELKSQVDLNKLLEDGETLLTAAVTYNRFQMIEILFENNASLFRGNSNKQTPLMVAAKLGYRDIVRLLMTLGSKNDYKDVDGNTALHLAVINKYEEIALYLINRQANIDITNNENLTALKIAESLNLYKVVSLLRSLTQFNVGLPDRVTVKNLVTLGDLETLNQLFTRYPILIHEYKDLNFFTLIIKSHGHDKALSMLHLLLGYGGDLNGPANPESTPLIEAVKRDYEDFIILMLKENVNPNGLDADNKSPLIWAIEANKQPLVKILLDKNAMTKYSYDLNGKNKTMKACDVARAVKKRVTSTEDKKSNEDILDLLGCGLRWLF
jgi:ankyrin repeat protein